MGLRDFFNRLKEDREVEKIVNRVQRTKVASDLVTKAISFRNLGQYDNAIKILNEVLMKYPYYLPAKVVLGSTLRVMRKVDEAERQFKSILREHADGTQIALTDVYANLGVIYYFDKNDIQSALKYYNLALNAPVFEKYGSEVHESMLSAVHRDLSYIYFIEREYELAKKYALLRIKYNENCHITSKVYGLLLINEFIVDNERITYVPKKIENKNLMRAVQFLKKSLSEDQNDYASIGGITLAFYFLSQMPFYVDDPTTYKCITEEHSKYVRILEIASTSSNEAGKYFTAYNELMISFGTQVLQTKHPGIVIKIEKRK